MHLKIPKASEINGFQETKVSEYMEHLSPYEIRELNKIRQRSIEPGLLDRATKSLPLSVRNRLARVSDKASQIATVKEDAESSFIRAGLLKSMEGLNKLLAKTAHTTTRQFDVLESYRKVGYRITKLSEIHDLDLEVVDGVRPNSLIAWYTFAGGVTGFGTGLAISGGELAVGTGAGAVPGFGVISAAMAADAAAVLTLSHAVVAQTARYYGFDPERPGEAILAMEVINAGSALTAASKYAALSDLSKLTQALARRAAWDKLNERVLAQIANRFARFMGVRLTKAGLSKIVPAAGIALGAGTNAYIVNKVALEADFYYRERFLTQKSGPDGSIFVPSFPTGPNNDDDSDEINLFEIIDEAIKDNPDE